MADVGEDGDEGVGEDVTVEDARFGEAFGLGGADVGFVDFVEDGGAVEADVAAESAEDADEDGQREVEGGFETPHGEEAEFVGEDVLAEEDPDDVVDAHEEGGEQKDAAVGHAVAARRTEEREGDGGESAEDEDGYGEQEGGEDAVFEDAHDGDAVFGGFAEVAGEDVFEVVDELGVETEEERFVVAVFGIEVGDGLRSGVLAEDGFGR